VRNYIYTDAETVDAPIGVWSEQVQGYVQIGISRKQSEWRRICRKTSLRLLSRTIWLTSPSFERGAVLPLSTQLPCPQAVIDNPRCTRARLNVPRFFAQWSGCGVSRQPQPVTSFLPVIHMPAFPSIKMTGSAPGAPNYYSIPAAGSSPQVRFSTPGSGSNEPCEGKGPPPGSTVSPHNVWL